MTAEHEELTELVETAESHLSQVRRILRHEELQFVDLEPASFGVGVAVPFEDGEYVVVAVPPDRTDSVYCTLGVLKDVNQDRLAILTVCNTVVWNNPLLPAFLQDARTGWDILLQQRLSVSMVVGSPKLLADLVVALPQAVPRVRERFAEGGVRGQRYDRSEEDINRLLVRSLL